MGQASHFTLLDGGAQPLPSDWRRWLDALPEDLRDAYEERAALIEYDGGEKRATAERRAFECVLRQSGLWAAVTSAAPGGRANAING
jgi:hypothetical protein